MRIARLATTVSMRDVFRIGRGSLLGVAALASLCLTALGSAASGVNGLTINVMYTTSSLQARLSNGTVLASGTVVPPGPYSVVVYDSIDDSNPLFTMAGPGVSVSSDLNPTGMGIEVPMTFGPFLLEASSSYLIFDANMAGGSAISFTTSATGSSASPNDPSASSGSTSSGSATAKTLRSLALFIGGSGKPFLSLGGKPVKTLKAGKYSLIVGDSSRKVGLLIGHGSVHPTTLSGVAAVGASSRKVNLTSGTWFYEASPRGPKIYFKVT
jgi:hypothetical protein